MPPLFCLTCEEQGTQRQAIVLCKFSTYIFIKDVQPKPPRQTKTL